MAHDIEEMLEGRIRHPVGIAIFGEITPGENLVNAPDRVPVGIPIADKHSFFSITPDGFNASVCNSRISRSPGVRGETPRRWMIP